MISLPIVLNLAIQWHSDYLTDVYSLSIYSLSIIYPSYSLCYQWYLLTHNIMTAVLTCLFVFDNVTVSYNNYNLFPSLSSLSLISNSYDSHQYCTLVRIDSLVSEASMLRYDHTLKMFLFQQYEWDKRCFIKDWELFMSYGPIFLHFYASILNTNMNYSNQLSGAKKKSQSGRTINELLDEYERILSRTRNSYEFLCRRMERFAAITVTDSATTAFSLPLSFTNLDAAMTGSGTADSELDERTADELIDLIAPSSLPTNEQTASRNTFSVTDNSIELNENNCENIDTLRQHVVSNIAPRRTPRRISHSRARRN